MAEETREGFCGVCVSGLAALAGMGATGGSRGVKNKKTKKIIFWTGVGVTLLSIIILIYLLLGKQCNACSSE